MATDISVEGKSSDVFKTFPEFSKLTPGDRHKYEKLIADYPPDVGVCISDAYELVEHA